MLHRPSNHTSQNRRLKTHLPLGTVLSSRYPGSFPRFLYWPTTTSSLPTTFMERRTWADRLMGGECFGCLRGGFWVGA
jgi:hypothetical protein